MWNDLFFRIRATFRRDATEGELDDELRFHYEQQVGRLLASGISRPEAERRARLALGSMEQMKEECRQARGIGGLEILAQDLRYALRILGKNPGFTAVASLTLALGIGANTAIFSLVNTVLLRPLPYPGAPRIVMLWGTSRAANDQPFSDPDFLDYQAQNHVFENMATFNGGGFTLTGGDNPERVRSAVVSTGFFNVLGITPARGRTFTPSDGQPGRNDVLLLTYGTWQRRFGGDKAIVGRSISVNEKPCTVIGVCPPASISPFRNTTKGARSSFLRGCSHPTNSSAATTISG